MALLFYSYFNLYPKGSINAKHSIDKHGPTLRGLNLKLNYQNENLYTTVMFHPSLGDASCESFVESLKKGIPFYCLENFKEEFFLKKTEKYFLDFINHELKSHATVQKNNLTLQDLSDALGFYNKGFKRLKFKMNPQFFLDQDLYLDFLKSMNDVEFIFDFNSSGSVKEFQGLNWPKEIMKRVYWEDPLELTNIDSVKSLKENGYKIILDQKKHLYSQDLATIRILFDIVAVKPTKESVTEILKLFPHAKLLITTNMGDELDHVISAHWANLVYTKFPDRFFGAGLFTRHFYGIAEGDPFVNFHKDQWILGRELDPKVRTSFFRNDSVNAFKGWGLDSEMLGLDWIFIRDLDVPF